MCRVPGEDFTVRDVMSHVGAERLIDVINTETQSAHSWSMEKWVKYYESDPAQRKRVFIRTAAFFCSVKDISMLMLTFKCGLANVTSTSTWLDINSYHSRVL